VLTKGQTGLRLRPGRLALRKIVDLADSVTAPHGLDQYIRMVRPTWSSIDVRARVARVVRNGEGSVTLTITPNGNWNGFVAGQYAEVTVEIDGVHHTRCYSMACSDRGGRRTIEFTVKAQPGGIVSNFLNQHARRGMLLMLSPPRGEFTLAPSSSERLVFISGGSGITPVLSMLRSLCDARWVGPITFLHYSTTMAMMPYSDVLSDLAARHENVTLVKVFTDQPGQGDLDGFLSHAQLDQVAPGWEDALIYVCGPAPLMASARAIADARGCATRVFTEAFTLTEFVAEAGSIGGSLHFSGSGVTVDNNGRGILEQAESAGLNPLFGCRMGICHTCTRKLDTGTVRNHVNGEVITGQDVEIRLCVNVPLGDVSIDL
jgi:stearoyl-CoA 9-desaturase NADPH oxidoreductase